MVKINLTKTQKTALAVLVAAIVAAAALFVALPMMEPDGPDYAAVVDVKVYGPGWTIVAEDVGVDNATVLNVIKAAGEKNGFELSFSGISKVESLNDTQNDGNISWHYGFAQIDNVKSSPVFLPRYNLNIRDTEG